MKDGWQIELPENWLEHGNPWEFGRREAAYEIGFGGQVVTGVDIGNQQQRRWKPAEKLRGLRLRHAHRRLARQAREHAQAVDGARRRPDPPRRLQQRRLWRGPGREQQGGDHHPRALPRRLNTRRPGAAPAPGVFLHLRLAAGHHPPPHAAIWRGAFAGRQGRDPAQRHAPGDCRGRAHAHPRRPPRLRLGRGLGHHPRLHRLHQPHAAARGAGKLARPPVRARAAAAHADHLPDQRQAHCRCAEAAGLHQRLPRLRLAHRRAQWTARAHGPAGLRGLAFDQRRLGTPHLADEAERVPRPQRRSIPAASTTRPTASRRGAGCWAPIRSSRPC